MSNEQLLALLKESMGPSAVASSPPLTDLQTPGKSNTSAAASPQGNGFQFHARGVLDSLRALVPFTEPAGAQRFNEIKPEGWTSWLRSLSGISHGELMPPRQCHTGGACLYALVKVKTTNITACVRALSARMSMLLHAALSECAQAQHGMPGHTELSVCKMHLLVPWLTSTSCRELQQQPTAADLCWPAINERGR